MAHIRLIDARTGLAVAQRAGKVALAERDDERTLILRFVNRERAERALPHWQQRLPAAEIVPAAFPD